LWASSTCERGILLIASFARQTYTSAQDASVNPLTRQSDRSEMPEIGAIGKRGPETDSRYCRIQLRRQNFGRPEIVRTSQECLKEQSHEAIYHDTCIVARRRSAECVRSDTKGRQGPRHSELRRQRYARGLRASRRSGKMDRPRCGFLPSHRSCSAE